jgi:hypothetical protein
MEKWQRNVIYRAVVAGGLDPRECTFDYGDAGARITHVPSASYLLLEGDITKYIAKAVIGESEKWPGGLRAFWIEVEQRVRAWAKEVTEDSAALCRQSRSRSCSQGSHPDQQRRPPDRWRRRSLRVR